jgi:hypothetical protein
MSRSLYTPVRIRRLYIDALKDAEMVRNKISTFQTIGRLHDTRKAVSKAEFVKEQNK